MNEADARRVLLLQSLEEGGPAASWRSADAEWASEQARREVGEAASAESFLVARARWGCRRLAEREPALAPWLPAEAAPGGLGAWKVVGVICALVLGLMGDSLGGGQRINILAPPLIGLLLWNLGVYLALLARVALPTGDPRPGPVQRAALHLLAWLERAPGEPRMPAPALPPSSAATPGAWPAVLRAGAAWAHWSQPLQAARLAAWLHTAAAALAVGAIGSLYLRGLAFEYLAGWSSTFLSPPGVHTLLAAVLGPASALIGVPLPGEQELAALRFSAGPGENAARWIHLYAVTLAGVVVLPRGVLALVAALRAHRQAAQVRLPLDLPYFQRLRRAHAGQHLSLCVQPFNYQLPPALHPALHRALDHHFGPGVQMRVAGNVPLAAEPAPAPTLQPGEGLALLFSLAATPERETHGSFLASMAARTAPGALRVVVDESGYRQRLSAADAATRLPQRRAAWQALLEETGHPPVFVDLAEGTAP